MTIKIYTYKIIIVYYKIRDLIAKTGFLSVHDERNVNILGILNVFIPLLVLRG